MISERPAEVEDRAVPGHWEGDLLLGKKPTGIATSGRALHSLLPARCLARRPVAEAVRDALVKSIGLLPAQLRRSLTWDQGREMLEHAPLHVDSGVQVYFCDPRSPWQRGSNENTNGLLRQYFPKRSDMGSLHPGATRRRRRRAQRPTKTDTRLDDPRGAAHELLSEAGVQQYTLTKPSAGKADTSGLTTRAATLAAAPRPTASAPRRRSLSRTATRPGENLSPSEVVR